MRLLVNLRHLDAHTPIVRLQGQLSVNDLDLDTRDEMIQAAQPLDYALEVQKFEQGLLAQGRLRLILECRCVRCLKPFQYRLALDRWARHLALLGEERVAVVNDCVDLTPFVREDILLEFPPHPLCDPGCRGLPKTFVGKADKSSGAGKSEASSSAWAELNKLKF